MWGTWLTAMPESIIPCAFPLTAKTLTLHLPLNVLVFGNLYVVSFVIFDIVWSECSSVTLYDKYLQGPLVTFQVAVIKLHWSSASRYSMVGISIMNNSNFKYYVHMYVILIRTYIYAYCVAIIFMHACTYKLSIIIAN